MSQVRLGRIRPIAREGEMVQIDGLASVNLGKDDHLLA